MSELDKALADVKQEGSDPFADVEKDTPAESPTAETKEEVKVEPPKEEDVPFHKHPRWIEREQELKTLREKEEENARVIAELSTFKDEVASKLPRDTTIPEWFKELYGENAVAWTKYSEREVQREAEIEQRLIQKQENERNRAQEETTRWNKWVDSQIAELEAEGKSFDRNELIKTMLDYRPTDEHNNFDFKKGYEIYQALKPKEDPAKSIARKELADITATVKGDKKQKDYLTPHDLRNKSWSNL